MSNNDLIEHLEIRRSIDDWALWRDSGDWDRFATVWHPQGRMNATWFKASATDFIARSRRAWDEGAKVFHMLGGTSIELEGSRAVAQTKMQIIQRGPVHGVLVEVTCCGRFWDAFEKSGERWLIRHRQPIYELDRMTPVSPSEPLRLDEELLNSFPEGYRHLAYLQTQIGFNVYPSLPGTRGPEIEALMERGRRWLAGDAPGCLEVD